MKSFSFSSVLPLFLMAASCFAVPAHADIFYVANSGSASIEDFSAAGTDLGVFATTPLTVPSAIALDIAGSLYVTFDQSSSTIEKFSPTGVDLGAFASTGLVRPYGLAFDSAGNLYAANYGNNTVEKFSFAGADLGVFASANLSGPVGLAFDTAGNLYVSNTGSSTIEKFSSAGSDLGVFASTGLSRPYGLAFDSAGNLYAANYDSGTVEKFSGAGADLGAFASTGLDSPIDLAFDSAGNLYVVNEGSATIRKISAAGVDLGVFATGPAGSSPASIATRPGGTVTGTGILQFGASVYNVDETAGSVTIVVSRTGGSVGVVSVSYATSDGTALAGTDYTATSGILTWTDGNTIDQQITVPILGRSLDDGNTLSFSINLFAAAGGATLGAVSTTNVEILDRNLAPQPTITITSPPDGLTVAPGASVPFAASVLDPGGIASSVQILVNNVGVYQSSGSGPFVYTATAPPVPGTYTIEAVVTDSQGRTNTDSVTVNVAVPAASAAAPTVSLLTPVNGLTLPVNSTITLSVGALAASTTALQQVSLYANGTLIESFDGQGNPMALGGTAGQPVRRDAATGAANLFQANYTMPGISQILNVIAVALDNLGQSTVSPVASFTAVATTDQAPLIALAGLANDTHVALGSVNAISVTASDPDTGTTSSVSDTHPIRRDAGTNGILKQLEYFVNGLSLGVSTAPPYGFNFAPQTPGKYVLEAVATDATGLSTLSGPLSVEVDAPTVSLSVVGDGEAFEGGAKAKVLVARTGDTSLPLTVYYKAKGTAQAGVDYQTLPGTIIIPAGSDHAKIKVKPIDGSPNAGTLKVKLKLLAPPDGVSYALGTAAKAKIILIGD